MHKERASKRAWRWKQGQTQRTQQCLAVLLILMTSKPINALEPLGVIGPVVEAKPYYAQLLRSRLPNQNTKLSPSAIGQIEQWGGVERYDSGLQPARFAPTPFKDGLADTLITPICLLANDERSMAWLTRNQATLKREKAVCYLVKSQSENDVAQLRLIAPAITFITLNPAFVIERFGVPGYPVLISQRGMEQ